MSYLANRIQPLTLESFIAVLGTRPWHPADCSTFGLTAQLSHTLAARADDAVGLLLTAATLPPGGAAATSSPVWGAEALHRAYATLQLFLRLHQSSPLIDHVTRDLEFRLAADLANNLRALATADPQAPSAGAPVLRTVVHNLVALFGPAAGDVQVETDIEPVTLPGAARRALVLLAHELVADAMLHASAGRPGSRIFVTLRPLSSGLACLTVTEDGGAFSNEHRQPDTIATSLAALLLADLHYAERQAGYTTAVIFGVGGAGTQPQPRACRNSRQRG